MADFHSGSFVFIYFSGFPNFQTPSPDELSEPNLSPLLIHPATKSVARSPCCDCEDLCRSLSWAVRKSEQDMRHKDCSSATLKYQGLDLASSVWVNYGDTTKKVILAPVRPAGTPVTNVGLYTRRITEIQKIGEIQIQDYDSWICQIVFH